MQYRRTNRHYNFDWVLILIYLLFISFGWLNILSSSQSGDLVSFFDLSQAYGKQLVFICISIILIIVCLSLEPKFYERFSSLFYIVSVISLLGLFVLGKTINGATSWYDFGGLTIQPSEFAKVATALAVAKYISDLQTNIKEYKHQLKALVIVLIPALLIMLQNDLGSTLIFISFFFVFYREGIPRAQILVILLSLIISVLTLKYTALYISVSMLAIVMIYFIFFRKKRQSKFKPILIVLVCIGFAYGVQFFYSTILRTHQQERINLWLRLESDPIKLEAMKKTSAYNIIESEKALSSGRITGKGFGEGTRTIGKFVPEQHTDFIFTTVGEEWGFLGTSAVTVLYIILISRIIFLADLQKKSFSRIYGYSLASILFTHFAINIGMVMGLLPTIGIPLPFFSYGGSNLIAFTLLLFIFIKLDSNRINEW